MSLENSTYISQLDPSQPALSDLAGQSAAQIKNVKSVLQNTFPNANGPLPFKPADFGGITPVGGVIRFWGDVATIPANWHVLDGSTVTINGLSVVLPDTRGKFTMAASPTVALGTTGGAASNTPTVTVAGTALTVDQMPSHNHPMTDDGHAHGTPAQTTGNLGTPNQGTSTYQNGYQGAVLINAGGGISTATAKTGIQLASTGGGNTHAHAATITTVPTLPPYVALWDIIRLS